MITAIVLIEAAVGQIPETAQCIADLPGVDTVYSCAGDVDLIAIIKVRDHEAIATTVTGSINRVPGVTSTRTHIAFEVYSAAELDAAFSIGE